MINECSGFAGDIYAYRWFQNIVKDNDIESIIETGTYQAATTRHFCEWCDDVHSVDIDKQCFDDAMLSGVPAHFYFGSSDKVLDEILPSFKNRKTLIFLDAHWNEYNPLLNELAAIAKHGLKPVIAIHDFQVPGHDELGYDKYPGMTYEFNSIAPEIVRIYGENGFTVEYNSEATGESKRGIIVIFPKIQWSERDGHITDLQWKF